MAQRQLGQPVQKIVRQCHTRHRIRLEGNLPDQRRVRKVRIAGVVGTVGAPSEGSATPQSEDQYVNY